MQQNQQERRFAPTQQQPVYRFPQNQPQGWQPQTGFQSSAPVEEPPLTRRDRRTLDRAHKRKRRRIFTLWNLFAVIGIMTVIIQAARYIVIPLLVYLNVLSGGAL